MNRDNNVIVLPKDVLIGILMTVVGISYLGGACLKSKCDKEDKNG